MATLNVDPEWQEIAARFMAHAPPTFTDPLEFRKANDEYVHSAFSQEVPEGVQESKHTFASLDGTGIDVYRLLSSSAPSGPKGQRAIVYVIGGGMMSGSAELGRGICGELAKTTGSQAFSVGWRIAPEHRGPAGVEDVYSCVLWLQANAATFGIDPARIVLRGDSAGAGISAGAALMARDKGLQPPLAGQLLKYPMLDDRTTMPTDHPMFKHLAWTVANNDLGWKSYTGLDKSERTDENVSIYTSPARTRDFSGLPATYIDVGDLDLFKDEAIAYADGLAKANVKVEFHLYPGVPHGWDGLGAEMGITRIMNENQIRWFLSL